MLRIRLLTCCLIFTFFSRANTVVVKNIAELKMAQNKAKPGDMILLQNGVWNNVILSLNCHGTKEYPITFKAQNAGRVSITGKSGLRLGGSFIVVDGLNFINGFAGDEAIISFRIDKKEIANNCRVTNIVINDFNNPKRMDENYWVSLYGKNNRVDHCSFLNKKNMGVLLAVILDDERSRENFHLIDHNYFGVRLPLASNTGETIRVGVSQHCEFKSNTQIVDNFFENCDGEAEIVSIKSCNNIIRNNVFKECQGAVVLRHGNYNTVENNIFLGNNKEGTGGVRIINKGQWVVNNYFYKCRGTAFRAPLSLMNGVPNSPAFRYVEVTDAVIANNSFYECTPVSFGLGSDTERTVQPTGVEFANNIFYNSKESLVYVKHDDVNGFHFNGNKVSRLIQQDLPGGFIKATLATQKAGVIPIPAVAIHSAYSLNDSIQSASRLRLSESLSPTPGFSDVKRFLQIQANALSDCGANWDKYKNRVENKKQIKVDCKTAEDIIQQLKKYNKEFLTINLTGKEYNFSSPLNINTDVSLTSAQTTMIKFSMPASISTFFIQVKAGKSFSMNNLKLDLASANANIFITTDTSGSSNHSNFHMTNSVIANLSGIFFHAAKSSVSDSIVINNCTFNNGKGILFSFLTEVDKKGYYNVEKLKINNCTINKYEGQVLAMLRGGNDESTMGPLLIFKQNKIIATQNEGGGKALIILNGTQKSLIENNHFISSNKGQTLIHYEDAVSAVHLLKNNIITQSGIIVENKFVRAENNDRQ